MAIFNTVYGGEWGWWAPSSSVTARYKFAWDSKDYSWNNRDASWANVTYSSSWNLNYAVFNWSSSYLLANNWLSSSNYTVSVWMKSSQTSAGYMILTNGSGNNMQSLALNYSNSKLHPDQYCWIWSSNWFATSINVWDWKRHNVISIRNWTTWYIYVDWVLAWSWTVTSNLYTDQWSIWAQKYYNQRWYSWAMSNLIIDQSPRTVDEVYNYYKATKSAYGL
jgi:hypothetical protein